MSKIDYGYVWTAVTIKLGCVPGKGIIGLLWSSFNVWRPSKFSFRFFYQLSTPICNCGIIKLRYVSGKRIIGLLWSNLYVWRPSKFSLRDFFSVTYTNLELWYHKAQVRAWQRSHRASSLNVLRRSNHFYLEFFFGCIYPSPL